MGFNDTDESTPTHTCMRVRHYEALTVLTMRFSFAMTSYHQRDTRAPWSKIHPRPNVRNK